MKRWIIQECDETRLSHCMETYGISALAGKILLSRGFTEEEFQSFFHETEEVQDPFLLKDMDVAVNRIQKAIEQGEKITVFGDYDADGITSTVVLYQYLYSVGAEVDYYIPDRVKEGYGMNPVGVQVVAKRGTDLIITVDNGISAVKEVELAKSLGIDVVITDHHQPQKQLPAAVAVVNPHQKDCPSKFKLYAGVGVVFKLICALEGNQWDYVLDQFSDFITIGTIADVMPLVGENRCIVTHGLRQMAHSENLGLSMLLKACGISLEGDITAQDIGFKIAPKINAAGRIGQVSQAIEAFIEEEEERAQALVSYLMDINEKRKELEVQGLALLLGQLQQDKKLGEQRVIVLYHPELQEGVVGILASRIAEKYHRPTIILTKGEQGQLKGSGRTVGEFHLFLAVDSAKEFLLGFGGHKMAVGLSLEEQQLEKFTEIVNGFAKEQYEGLCFPQLSIDCAVKFQDVTLDALKALSVLEPMGVGNLQPLFFTGHCEILEIHPMAKGAHTRLTLKAEGRTLKVNLFQQKTEEFLYPVGDFVDLVYTAQIQIFLGREQLSFTGEDLRPAGLSQQLLADKSLCVKLQLNELILPKEMEKLIPNREEIGRVYRLISQDFTCTVQMEKMYYLLGNGTFHYGKLLVSLMVLLELHLVKRYRQGEKVYYKVVETKEKVDLEQSFTLQYLKKHGKVRK